MFYPGYNSMTMAVSELSAVSSTSKAIADQLNSLFGPCGLVSIVAVWVSIPHTKPKSFRIGIALFMAMEWICNIGYSLFPWVSGESNIYFQNTMHLIVTAPGCSSFPLFPNSSRYIQQKSRTQKPRNNRGHLIVYYDSGANRDSFTSSICIWFI